jgi:hypothetical protein
VPCREDLQPDYKVGDYSRKRGTVKKVLTVLVNDVTSKVEFGVGSSTYVSGQTRQVEFSVCP